MVETICSSGSQGEYCKANASTKQILQIKAILEKNNKLGMVQLGVKMHYFAQLWFREDAENEVVRTFNQVR